VSCRISTFSAERSAQSGGDLARNALRVGSHPLERDMGDTKSVPGQAVPSPEIPLKASPAGVHRPAVNLHERAINSCPQVGGTAQTTNTPLVTTRSPLRR
jgi:hypothetical protein